MFNAKQIADTLTAARIVIAFILAWLGLARGPEGLPVAAWLMVIDWTGDSLDGVMARRMHPFYHTWIGDHDLEIDIAVSIGLLAYMVAAGFVVPVLAAAYVIVCFVLYWWLRMPRSMGMLLQAPVYGWFIVIALRHDPVSGWLLVGWIVAAIIVTWPQFPREMVPDFLDGMRAAVNWRRGSQD